MDVLDKIVTASGMSRVQLAARLRISPAAISMWARRGIPRKHWGELERITKYKVLREQMRPDIFRRRRLKKSA